MRLMPAADFLLCSPLLFRYCQKNAAVIRWYLDIISQIKGAAR